MITTLLIFVTIIGALMAIACILIYLVFIVGLSLFSELLKWLLKRD